VKMPDDQSKYISNWKYFEIAKYVKNLDRVIRIKNNDLPVLITDVELDNFVKQNDNTGLYTSIWRYNDKSLDSATRLASLYFDIDNKDQQKSLNDCIKLYEYLSNFIPKHSIVVYFTGKKGFHIECEAIALGINPSNNLPNIFRFIAENIKSKLGIESLDFSVYDARRMWRLAGSIHQETGLYKNIISEERLKSGLEAIIDYCKSPSENIVPEQQFSAKANEWFRGFTYELEVHKEKSKDFIGYFNKHGSSAFKSFQESEKEFTPKSLVENCHAVKRLWQQAIEKKYLEHEARLFLCSILTYNDESVKFLHGILSNCDDYNIEKTNSHINDWIKRRQLGIGGRPYTCERANAVGVGCGECSLEKRNKWIKVGDKYVETQDQSSPSPVRFAYKSIKKGGE
jgi:hypothetical protein